MERLDSKNEVILNKKNKLIINQHLDKNTIGAQALANRTAEEVCQLQNEVNMLNDKLDKMDKQIQIERELVNFLTTRTKEMKLQLLEDMVNI